MGMLKTKAVSERLKTRTPLSVTPLLPLIEPVVPPPPICRVPLLMVVPPVYVLEPVRISAPHPPS